jgi:Protein of unknown function (DUF4236)
MAYLRARRSIRVAPGGKVKLNERSVGITAGTGAARYPVNTSGGRTVASLSWVGTVASGTGQA